MARIVKKSETVTIVHDKPQGITIPKPRQPRSQKISLKKDLIERFTDLKESFRSAPNFKDRPRLLRKIERFEQRLELIK